MTSDITQKDIKTVENIATELFQLLGLTKAQLKLEKKEKNQISLDIKYDNPSLLIGKNGETLQSIQNILRLLVYKKLAKWVIIICDCDSYLSQKQEKLERIAQNLSQKAKFSHEPQELNSLNSAERRIVHLFLKDNPEVSTESIDTPQGRTLIIKPK